MGAVFIVQKSVKAACIFCGEVGDEIALGSEFARSVFPVL